MQNYNNSALYFSKSRQMNRSDQINLIKIALDSIRPYLQKDDGDISFIELTEDNVLKVKYSDSCKGCKFKEQTKYIVEKHIRRFFPNLKEMIEVEE